VVGARPSRGNSWAVAALIGVFALLALYLHLQWNNEVSNDHAGYLAMARQIGFGEIPIRDFLDHGTFLHLWISTATRALGDYFLPELLMSWAFIVAGQALAMYLVWRGTGSIVAAAITGVVGLLLFPRPYSFPKVFVYPVTVLLLWAYVDDPRWRRLRWIGVWAAVALLLRVDHGVAVLLSAAGTAVLVHAPTAVRHTGRALGELTAAFVVTLLPFLVFLAVTVGISTHVENILAFGRYGLGQREPIRWLSFWTPPVFSEGNGTAFLYDAILLLTGAALVWAVAIAIRDLRRTRRFSSASLRFLTVVGLWLTSAPMLVRDNLGARIPDASSILMVLAGMVAVPWLTLGAAPARPVRRAYGAAWAGVAVLAVVAAGQADAGRFVIANAGQLFSSDGVDRARGVVRDLLVSPPIQEYADTDIRGTGGLARYLYECTRPSDRVLITYFAPQLFVYAERGFAGGQWMYLAGYHNSPDQQRETLDKLEQEDVPVVILRRSEWESFRANWGQLVDHVERRYRRIENYALGDIEVWAANDRPVSGLIGGDVPCFR
jgi:hypothetical protein